MLAVTAPAARGQERDVALELVLAVDVSGSVSPAEFALQGSGLAGAFRDPAVHTAIEAAGESGIAVALLHWSGSREQELAVGWSLISDARMAAQFADKIEATNRRFAGVTAIGEALEAAASAADANAYRSNRIVIDVSGDGRTNFGHDTRPIRDRIAATGTTMNGLAITDEDEDLVAYYKDHVAGGPGAFVMSAANARDFVQAIRSKLIQEILGRPSS